MSWVSEFGDPYGTSYIKEHSDEIKPSSSCGPYIRIGDIKLYAVKDDAIRIMAEIHKVVKSKKSICIVHDHDNPYNFLAGLSGKIIINKFGIDGKCDNPDTCLSHPMQSTAFNIITCIDPRKLPCKEINAKDYDKANYTTISKSNWHVIIPKGYRLRYWYDKEVRLISFEDLADLRKLKVRKQMLEKMSDEDQRRFAKQFGSTI